MQHFIKIILFILVIGSIGLSVAACGRYSAPSPIEGSGYPHKYPQY